MSVKYCVAPHLTSCYSYVIFECIFRNRIIKALTNENVEYYPYYDDTLTF